MSVIRIKKSDNFVSIHKGALENPKLSFKAKGLWAYCMSRKNDWVFHVSHLSTVSKEGEDAIYSAIKELEAEGYVKKIQKNISGKFQKVDYEVYEEPQLKKCLPHRDFPDAGFPDAGNPALVNIDSIVNIDKQIKPPNPQKGEAPKGACEFLAFGKFVSLRKEDHERFCKDNGFEVISGLIDEINDYLLSSGKKPYKDYAAAIRQWLRRRKQQQKPIVPASNDTQLNDLQKQNWKLNQDLVQELKIDYPDKASGLNFFYKHYVLKDRNDPSFDISGLVNHRDFCRVLGKHLKLNIEEVRFQNGQIQL